MTKLIFSLIQLFILSFRTLLAFPIIFFRQFSKFIKNRLEFERQNLFADECRAFVEKADFLFHVSSEGELEQAYSLIETFLKQLKKIEIVFTSPSVEKKCLELYRRNPSQIRILRLPLLSFFPIPFFYFQSLWFWMSAPVVIMVRYDFFPELLIMAPFKKMILISAASKKWNWYKEMAHRQFDLIVCANEFERHFFEQRNILNETKLKEFDFRIPRIFQRLHQKLNVLNQNEHRKRLFDYFSNLGVDNKIIMGSAWPSDLEILNNPQIINEIKNQQLKLLIVPHELDDKNLEFFKLRLTQLFGPNSCQVYSIDCEVEHFSFPPITILNMRGILCELYSLFKICYIGNGFQKSIHSVLEPFLANCLISCGPKINRSTEIDLIKSEASNELFVFNSPDQFYDIIEKMRLVEVDLEKREEIEIKGEHLLKEISFSIA
jgi:3-deoxy-D-manno-octulosonic-acid transferase